MLDRVPVDVVKVPEIVGLIPDQMLPEPVLPDGSLLALDAALRQLLLAQQGCSAPLGDGALDGLPAAGKIVVTRGSVQIQCR